MKALIAGGGIGGLTAAIAMRNVGIEVEVLERAKQISEIGAGIQIAANATRVLEHLGLGDALKSISVAAEAVIYRDLATDDRLFSVPLGDEAAERYGASFYQCHRGELLGILRDHLPNKVITTDARVTEMNDAGSGVQVRLENGKTVEGDVLIGADGIHSLIRGHVHGTQDAKFSRIIAYRSLIPAERVAPLGLEQSCYSWLGHDKSVVAYYISSGNVFNFVGIAPAAVEEKESWTTIGEVDQLRATYADSNETVQAIAALVDETFITGYYFREPLTRWSSGRVALLGDAAHAMHPFWAQGACQAIEDAVVLAGNLSAKQENIEEALANYDKARVHRASEVQSVSKDEEQRWHMSDPKRINIRNGVYRSIEQIDPLATCVGEWLYGYDAVKVASGNSPTISSFVRPEAVRAAELWDSFLQPQDRSRGVLGMRAAYSNFLSQHMPPPADLSAKEVTIGGVPCLWLEEGNTTGPVLVHVHGGGFVAGSADTSVALAARIAKAVDGRCLIIDYRLAPEHPFPAAVEDVTQVLRKLGSGATIAGTKITPGSYILSGESAGGGLAVSACIQLRDESARMPLGLVALSPMVDLAVQGESSFQFDHSDPVCSRRELIGMSANYLLGADPDQPLASPITADLRGLPPMCVHAASNESLRSDAERLVDRARQHDVEASLSLVDDSVHVFPMFDFLPEATEAMQQVRAFVQRLTQEES